MSRSTWRRGEVLCLAGENGCGKCTLIKIISGVYPPEPGADMLFDGKPMEELTPGMARSLGIQVIWQDLALFPEMTVAENIAFERNLGGRPQLVDYGAMRNGRGGHAGRAGRQHRSRYARERALDRTAPDRRDLPRAGGGNAARLHGRADRLPQPVGNRRAARHRAAAVRRWHRRRLRQPPAGRGAGGLQPRHGAARRPLCRDLPDARA